MTNEERSQIVGEVIAKLTEGAADITALAEKTSLTAISHLVGVKGTNAYRLPPTALDIPTAQTTPQGNQTTFIYSLGSPINGFTVLSSGTKIFQNGGKLKFKKVNWGASDPTNGNDYIIPTATTSNDGAMSREDKAKLDGYTTGFSNNQVATLTTNGLMSKEDKGLLVAASSVQEYVLEQITELQTQLQALAARVAVLEGGGAS